MYVMSCEKSNAKRQSRSINEISSSSRVTVVVVVVVVV